MELNPSALTDGKFLANVLIDHPADQNHDIRQKRFWPYYHENNRPFEEYSPNLQLIRPAPEAELYAAKKIAKVENMGPSDPVIRVHSWALRICYNTWKTDNRPHQ